MEIVRLGEGVDRTGRLTEAAIKRTKVALADYAAEVRRWGAQRVRVVATSATRDAANADDFTAMVLETLGVVPEVASGEEEAQLSYVGAVRGLPASAAAPYLMVDIGGGSTEFVLGSRPDRYERAASVDVGCVRMTERHLRTDPSTAAEVAEAEADIAATVDQALAAIGGPVAQAGGNGPRTADDGNGGAAVTMIGLAGSVTTVAAIALGLSAYDSERIHHVRVSRDDVAKVATDLLAMTREQRLAIPVMHPGRADVIGAGALILRVAMERAGVDSVIASEHDILDGIAWSLA